MDLKSSGQNSSNNNNNDDVAKGDNSNKTAELLARFVANRHGASDQDTSDGQDSGLPTNSPPLLPPKGNKSYPRPLSLIHSPLPKVNHFVNYHGIRITFVPKEIKYQCAEYLSMWIKVLDICV